MVRSDVEGKWKSSWKTSLLWVSLPPQWSILQNIPFFIPPGIDEMRQNTWWKDNALLLVLLFLYLYKPLAPQEAANKSFCFWLCCLLCWSTAWAKTIACSVIYDIFWKDWRISSCNPARRRDGAAPANTAALQLLTSQRRPPTLPAV